MDILDVSYIVCSFVAVYLSLVWLIVYMENRKTLHNESKSKKTPSVTFIVPAHNEEKNIKACLESLLKLDYPKGKVKIIVVDDGSTDRTAEIARKFNVRVLSKKNEGSKASAMNYGMEFVKTDLVACMDADSTANSDYLLKVVRQFTSDKIGAVTSGVKIRKVTTFASQIQWVEYMMSVITRKVFSLLDCQFVVPGPGGIYRTKVLKRIGKFETDNLTEDMEMALRLHVNGYKIANSLDAYVYTVCPESFKDLFKQRMRWYRGYLENFSKYIGMFLNTKYGNFGLFFLPTTILWIAILIVIFSLTVGNFVFESAKDVFYWSLVNYELRIPDLSFSIYSIDSFFMAMTIATAIGLLVGWIGIKNAGKEDVKNRKLFYAIYIIAYPIIFSFFWTCALVLHIFKVKRKW
jgi:cellulose synthase/poly-beta-1,6-N-acetylglucosamine synthase-like glycosyltransferase